MNALRDHGKHLLVVTLLLLASRPAFGTAAAGVVLVVNGPVEIRSGPAKVAATTGMALNSGDTLHSTGGTASVLMASGQTRILAKGETITLTGAKDQGQDRTLANRLVATLAETTSAGQGPTIKGMVRGDATIVAVHPHNTAIRPDDIRLAWLAPPNLVELRLTVRPATGDQRLVVDVPAGQSSVIWPASALPLACQTRHYWKVEGKDPIGGRLLGSPLYWFAILGPEQAAALEADLAAIDQMAPIDADSRRLLRANRLIAAELYQEAADILRAVLGQRPADTGLKGLVRGVLLKMNNTAEAGAIQ